MKLIVFDLFVVLKAFFTKNLYAAFGLLNDEATVDYNSTNI